MGVEGMERKKSPLEQNEPKRNETSNSQRGRMDFRDIGGTYEWDGFSVGWWWMG